VSKYADRLRVGRRHRGSGGKGGGTRLFTEADTQAIEAEISRCSIESFHARKRELRMLDTAEVATKLGVSTGMVHVYATRGQLPFVEEHELNGVSYRLFAPDTVEAFERTWARGGDGRRQRWLRPDQAVAVYKSRGLLDKLAARRDITVAEAESLVRERAKARRENLIHHRSGRRPSTTPSPHHLEWADAFRQMEAQLIDDFEKRCALGLLEPDDRRPSRRNIALAVAERDYAARPDRWPDYPHAPGDPKALHPAWADTAESRVLGAIKRLQTRVTETPPG
jgi:hypothetical protein